MKLSRRSLSFAAIAFVAGSGYVVRASPTFGDRSNGIRIYISCPARVSATATGPYEQVINSHDGFDVVIQNVSTRPLRVYLGNNSWGEQTLSFLVTDSTGKTLTMTRKPVGGYTGNGPLTARLLPGQVLTRKVELVDTDSHPQWLGMPLGDDLRVKYRLRAVLTQPTPGNEKPEGAELWKGRSESAETTVTFFHPYLAPEATTLKGESAQ